ncbi:hypothetical protein L210DRAFT_945946 [Boletus edulis BED1]|uniref:Uncharacterized protein n=1 Tax=Boletus edulis BED1 TaxID=1328754 RepID=A0AAD4GG29_BOLED|nr:hypothetical protein L210DRAFT_945946 [Boletus edulis BED1]
MQGSLGPHPGATGDKRFYWDPLADESSRETRQFARSFVDAGALSPLLAIKFEASWRQAKGQTTYQYVRPRLVRNTGRRSFFSVTFTNHLIISLDSREERCGVRSELLWDINTLWSASQFIYSTTRATGSARGVSSVYRTEPNHWEDPIHSNGRILPLVKGCKGELTHRRDLS